MTMEGSVPTLSCSGAEPGEVSDSSEVPAGREEQGLEGGQGGGGHGAPSLGGLEGQQGVCRLHFSRLPTIY